MPDQILKAARWYQKHGYSLIPIAENKTPLIKWQQYQKEKPSPEQIEEWWSGKFKGESIGIITGAISNLTVVDIDSKEGLKAIEEITPDSMVTPTANSPSGGEHRYFKHEEGISNAVKFLSDCDIRSEGGYIIAPPSSNGRGSYTWKPGLSIAETETCFLPEAYINALNNINTFNNREKVYAPPGSNLEDKRGQAASSGDKIEKGRRDDVLFRIANTLRKGGMNPEEILYYLTLIGTHACNPPYPLNDISTKVQSALQRSERQERGWIDEVRAVIVATSGDILTTNVHNWLDVRTRTEKQTINKCMTRLEKEGLLKRTGRRAGEYHIVNTNLQEVDWKNSKIEEVKITLPMGIHEAVKFVPSSIIMLSGVSNAGKTAFAMNIAYWNWKKINTMFFTSEIGGDEFNSRVVAHSDIPSWEGVRMFDGFEPNDLPDLLDPDGLNIIDYLEPPGGDYTQIAPVVTNIQHALNKGLAVICLQKKTNDPHGAGGQFVRNKSHLYCLLDPVDYPVCRLTLDKVKRPQYGYRNPGGLSVDYKVDEKNGVNIIPYGKFHFSKWR